MFSLFLSLCLALSSTQLNTINIVTKKYVIQAWLYNKVFAPKLGMNEKLMIRLIKFNALPGLV